MQKWILYLFALLLFAGAKAQPSKAKLEEAKFAIMKRTVEFLSEDTAFKNVQSHTCEGCKTVEDLKKFALDNKLINADSRVIDPLAKKTIDTSAIKWRQSLNEFKQQAINQITGAEREYRKSLPGYSDYTGFLDAAVADVKSDENTASESSAAQADKTGVVSNGTAQSNSLTALLLTWLPYIVAAVLLIVLIYVLSEKSKVAKRKAYYKDKVRRLENELTQKGQTITMLTAQNEKLGKELNDAELDRKSLEDRLKSLELKKVQKITPQPTAPPVSTTPTTIVEKPAPKPMNQPPKPPTPVAKIKYARYADTGDGFSNAELLDKPDGETIFELIIAPNNNTGEYRVTNNPDGQRYALSNAQYFLGKTCQYDSFPSGSHAVIKTEKPGTIKLTGGKWTIVNPAKISFS